LMPSPSARLVATEVWESTPLARIEQGATAGIEPLPDGSASA
jgi:hypothetical protein